jgi:hypothetical protein
MNREVCGGGEANGGRTTNGGDGLVEKGGEKLSGDSTDQLLHGPSVIAAGYNDKIRCRPARFDSITWNNRESRHPQAKLKLFEHCTPSKST